VAALLVLIAAIGSTLAVILTALNIREKLWPKPPAVHPLAAALADIAAASRERP
jgi:hypothetical protein